MERVVRVEHCRLPTRGRALGKLERGFVRFGSGHAEERDVEVARSDLREVVGERGGVLRHERERDLVALLVAERAARREDARVVVPERERPVAAEEVEDLPPALVDVVHALGVIDDHAIEAEQPQQPELSRTDVVGHEVGDVLVAEVLGLLDAHEVGLGGRAHRANRP